MIRKALGLVCLMTVIGMTQLMGQKKMDSFYGGQVVTVPDCFEPCEDKTIEFFECAHYEDFDPCNKHSCIEDHFFWFQCAETAGSPKKDCKVKFDKEAPRRFQVVRLQENGDKCGNVYQPFHPVKDAFPNFPDSNKCNSVGGVHRGKCFLDKCKGTILIDKDKTLFKGTFLCNK